MFNVGTISESKLLPAISHPKLMVLCINLFGDFCICYTKYVFNTQQKKLGAEKYNVISKISPSSKTLNSSPIVLAWSFTNLHVASIQLVISRK